MNNTKRLAFPVALALIMQSMNLMANQYGAYNVGIRYHSQHDKFADLPFGNGDISYGIGMEWHEDIAYWHIGAEFQPDPGRFEDIDFVITPSINLILKDGIWRGGVGALSNYAKRDRRPFEGEGSLQVEDNGGLQTEDDGGFLSDNGETDEPAVIQRDRWSKIYWQLLFGIHLPFFGMDVDIFAYYPFEKWSRLTSFRIDDLDYGVRLGFRF